MDVAGRVDYRVKEARSSGCGKEMGTGIAGLKQ
jgi:hypothetical protein